jgi:hypothetical protein
MNLDEKTSSLGLVGSGLGCAELWKGLRGG